jgi:hypothetical protein
MHTMNRRALVAGAAILPAIAILAAAQCVLAPDPVFAAIEAHKMAHAAWLAAMEAADTVNEDPDDAFGLNAAASERAMLKTVPTTLAGVAALVSWVHECERDGVEIHSLCMRENSSEEHVFSMDYGAFLRTIDTALASLVRS